MRTFVRLDKRRRQGTGREQNTGGGVFDLHGKQDRAEQGNFYTL